VTMAMMDVFCAVCPLALGAGNCSPHSDWIVIQAKFEHTTSNTT
jgi:hypothetical protein